MLNYFKCFITKWLCPTSFLRFFQSFVAQVVQMLSPFCHLQISLSDGLVVINPVWFVGPTIRSLVISSMNFFRTASVGNKKSAFFLQCTILLYAEFKMDFKILFKWFFSCRVVNIVAWLTSMCFKWFLGFITYWFL